MRHLSVMKENPIIWQAMKFLIPLFISLADEILAHEIKIKPEEWWWERIKVGSSTNEELLIAVQWLILAQKHSLPEFYIQLCESKTEEK